jgi:hypothetical protein
VDPSFIFLASTQASKVADFLLSFVRQPEQQTVGAQTDAAGSTAVSDNG